MNTNGHEFLSEGGVKLRVKATVGATCSVLCRFVFIRGITTFTRADRPNRPANTTRRDCDAIHATEFHNSLPGWAALDTDARIARFYQAWAKAQCRSTVRRFGNRSGTNSELNVVRSVITLKRKSGRGLPQSKTLRDSRGPGRVRPVLECAGTRLRCASTRPSDVQLAAPKPKAEAGAQRRRRFAARTTRGASQSALRRN